MSIEINEVETLAAGTGAKLLVVILDVVGCICMVIALILQSSGLAVLSVLLWIFGLLFQIERHLRVIASKK